MCVTWKAATIVGGVSLLHAGASILAGGGAAGHVGGLTVLAPVLERTAATVRAHFVDTRPAVETGGGALGALVHVLLAGLTVEGGGAGADVGGVVGRALAPVCTWVGRTGVRELAGFTFRAKQEGVIHLHITNDTQLTISAINHR